MIGFALGAVPGIALGMVMGLNRWVRAAVDPLISALYPIPKIAILPLLMMAFGLGDGSKVAVVAMSVLFLTVINTTTGGGQRERAGERQTRKDGRGGQTHELARPIDGGDHSPGAGTPQREHGFAVKAKA